MTDELQQQIRSCPSLPTLPTIAMEVLELAQKEEVDLGEIARTITRDPALAGKILKTVNSSFYGRAHAVSTVSHALVIMGLQSVKTLVLGFSLVTNLSKDRRKGFDHMKYWRRSIYAATAARTLCTKVGLVQQEEAFLAALLMDIGVLVLDRVMEDAYGEVHANLKSHAQLAGAEQGALGTTHAEVGAMLAEMWKLPPLLVTPIKEHHTPDGVADAALKRMTLAVGLGGRVADVYCDDEAAQAIIDVRDGLKKHFNMPEKEADALIAEIGTVTREVATLFEINLGAGGNFAEIMKRANEALVDLTLRMQQQTTVLQEQNQQLKVQATTDKLTGMANRATFDEFIGAEFAKAQQRGKPLSLLMLDIDKFKSINDRFGHPTGDVVLKTVGSLLKDSVRPGDLAARYGGEEMAIVLPDTDRSLAAQLAETLRRAIAARPISAGANAIPVTASIGVATFDLTVPFKQPAHLIKAADLAVYKAKHSGRNNVKVFTLPPAGAKAA
jgi:diguanylate cyclase (GGDEF)-like protein